MLPKFFVKKKIKIQNISKVMAKFSVFAFYGLFMNYVLKFYI